jgi:hypothetical protein
MFPNGRFAEAHPAFPVVRVACLFVRCPVVDSRAESRVADKALVWRAYIHERPVARRKQVTIRCLLAYPPESGLEQGLGLASKGLAFVRSLAREVEQVVGHHPNLTRSGARRCPGATPRYGAPSEHSLVRGPGRVISGVSGRSQGLPRAPVAVSSAFPPVLNPAHRPALRAEGRCRRPRVAIGTNTGSLRPTPPRPRKPRMALVRRG